MIKKKIGRREAPTYRVEVESAVAVVSMYKAKSSVLNGMDAGSSVDHNVAEEYATCFLPNSQLDFVYLDSITDRIQQAIR